MKLRQPPRKAAFLCPLARKIFFHTILKCKTAKGFNYSLNCCPVDDIDIEIFKFNIFIGPQASGKSTISKVLCIIHMFDYRKYYNTNGINNIELLKPLLAYYRVENFYNNHSYWYFRDVFFTFELKQGNILIKYQNEDNVPANTDSYYFPAERIALPMISESLFELNYNESSLPKFFLKFGRDFTIARKQQRVFNLPLLGVEFEHAEGKSKVFDKRGKPFLLEEASSAIQANLPLLVILQYPTQPASLFVIEELELHSFPQLQKKMLQYLIDRMRHPNLTDAYVMLPTHSPYLLSVANNLLFASKAGRVNNNEANGVIPQKYWIDQKTLTAYYIENGKAVSIIDNQTGLIHENMLDSISEDLAEEFDALMDIYKPAQV